MKAKPSLDPETLSPAMRQAVRSALTRWLREIDNGLPGTGVTVSQGAEPVCELTIAEARALVARLKEPLL